MGDTEGPVGDTERSGPPTALIIAGTLLAAAVVAGAILGILRFVRDDDDAGGPATTTAETVPPTTEAPERGDLAIRRVTADGIELRVAVNEGWAAVAPIPVGPDTTDAPGDTDPATSGTGPPTTDPDDLDGNGRPDVCDPIGDATGWVIDDDAILQASAPITAGRIGGLYAATFWGGGELTIAAAMGQVDDDVEVVSLRSPDGRVDEMAPVDGLFIVALPLPAGAPVAGLPPGGNPEMGWIDSYTVVARHANGRADTATGERLLQGHPAWSALPPCGIPGDVGEAPALPVLPEITLPPAGEPPADPAAARAAITASLELLYGNDAEPAERLTVIDDPYGLAEVLERIADGSFAEQAADAAVVVDEVVFPSPTEAFFRYSLEVPNADFGPQNGRARLIDGDWKVTRATYCQDLAKAGELCPP